MDREAWRAAVHGPSSPSSLTCGPQPSAAPTRCVVLSRLPPVKPTRLKMKLISKGGTLGSWFGLTFTRVSQVTLETQAVGSERP